MEIMIHGYFYLCLPVMATALNLALVVLVFSNSPKTALASLVPVQYEKVRTSSSNCINGEGESEGHSCTATYVFAPENITIDEGPIDAAHDPCLMQMPNRDFKACVRPDSATFYQKEPGSMRPKTHVFKGQAGKFVNLTPDRLSLYW